MQTGIFRGVENGNMRIEYPTTTYRDGKLVSETRIFSYPVAGKIRSVNWHFGTDAERGWPYEAMPVIGQAVRYDGPEPDMAGHLMVNVYPDEVA